MAALNELEIMNEEAAILNLASLSALPLSLGLSLALCASCASCLRFSLLSNLVSPLFHPRVPPFSFISSSPSSSLTRQLSISAARGLLLCRLNAVILKQQDQAHVQRWCACVCVCMHGCLQETGCFWNISAVASHSSSPSSPSLHSGEGGGAQPSQR